MPLPFASRHVLTVALASLALGGAATPLAAQVAAEATVGVRLVVAPHARTIGRGEPTGQTFVLAGDHRSSVPTEGETASIWKHLGVGFLVGAGAGLALGLYLDATYERRPSNFSAPRIAFPIVTTPLGGILGSVAGGVVWVVRQP